MTSEQKNAIISLSRHTDWQHLMSYIQGAARELEMSGMFIDPTMSIDIARLQGARNVLMNILGLEEAAHDMNKEDNKNG